MQPSANVAEISKITSHRIDSRQIAFSQRHQALQHIRIQLRQLLHAAHCQADEGGEAANLGVGEGAMVLSV